MQQPGALWVVCLHQGCRACSGCSQSRNTVVIFRESIPQSGSPAHHPLAPPHSPAGGPLAGWWNVNFWQGLGTWYFNPLLARVCLGHISGKRLSLLLFPPLSHHWPLKFCPFCLPVWPKGCWMYFHLGAKAGELRAQH